MVKTLESRRPCKKGLFMKNFILTSLITTTTLLSANDIVLSKGIKPEFREKIEKDMSVLSNLKFQDPDDNKTLNLLGLSTLNAETLTDWLNTRVNYIIEENAFSILKLLVKKVITIEKEDVHFPNENIIPYALDPNNQMLSQPTEAKEAAFVVMSNVGAALYMAGKEEQKVYALKVSRGLLKKGIKVSIESPRAGIIQVGEGLFMKGLSVNRENQESIANSINRLGTFFHEARHSDGNGVSLGFTHSLCPKGHELENAPACDENLNGPYTIGSAVTKELLKACAESCTEREKEILTIIILDSQNRIIKTTKKGLPTTNWDSRPESL